MANVLPFTGLRYNKEKIGNPASVVTPPYDIIDDKEQARYYAENPVNIIRLELGFTFPDDNEQDNRYLRAARYLEHWLEEEILIPESQPSFYVYQQEFDGPGGDRIVRTGFICGLKVEDYSQGNILPHEETLSKPKADRLKLMHATRCNFSSIFGLYNDPDKIVDNLMAEAVDGRSPDIVMVDEAGEEHRLWVVNAKKTVARVIADMRDRKIYIADGHHRYETALQYSKDMQAAGFEGYNYVMTTLVNLHDPGLVILPTHRLVGGIKDFDLNSLKEALEDLFEVEEFGTSADLKPLIAQMAKKGKRKHVFGMCTGEKKLYLLTLRNMLQAKKHLPKEKPNAWKHLDVALLDNLVLDRMLKIGADERKDQKHLVYTRDENLVTKAVDEGKYELGFLLNPTRVEEVVAVAEARDVMPQKSTYFFPKLITGLVINPLFKNL